MMPAWSLRTSNVQTKDGALIASRVKAEKFIKDESGKVIGIVARDFADR